MDLGSRISHLVTRIWAAVRVDLALPICNRSLPARSREPEPAAARQRSARRQEQIFRWFRNWVGEGLFAAIEI